MPAAWSKPFHGIQHLGQLNDQRWATVTDRGTFAELTRWHHLKAEGEDEVFASVELAQAAGERYIAGVA